MNHQDLAALLPGVEKMCREAGAAILEIYEQAETGVAYKDDRSPLTAADLASHRLLKERLAALTPNLPILSEEGAQTPFEERREWRRFWLVDPLDGTKEFIKRNGEFTVNVALVEDGEPRLGVVYAPVLERTYAAVHEPGGESRAWREDGAGGAGGRRAIRASGTGEAELVIVASRSHPSPELERFLAALPPYRLTSMGSSLKICLAAEGAADFYPRLGPTMEWDTGAAHAVVLAAGGRVVNTDGEPLVYNKENLLNPHFLVLGERQVPWRAALAAARTVDTAGAEGDDA